MDFLSYQHVERVGTSETEGLLFGECSIFPKIDGTNGSVWFHPEKGLQAGSRNRVLTPDADNAGFCKYVNEHPDLIALFFRFPSIRLYGEWLVPHTLRSYQDNAWRKFWIFDVFHQDRYVPYVEYKSLLEEYNLDYIPLIARIKNPVLDDLYNLVNENTFLIEEGKGIGEGIVVKNYDFINKFGRTVWGKLINAKFSASQGNTPKIKDLENILIEEIIVKNFLTNEFIFKEQAKIALKYDGWSSKNIPELLGRIWYEFIREEMTEILKKMKNPQINFRLLNKLVLDKTKEAIGI